MDERRKKFLGEFSQRLVTALRENGMESPNAQSGVKVANLAKAAGCSNQMARQYVQGESLPEAHAIQQIAEWLDIDPGYLLFGSQSNADNLDIPRKETVNINYETLETILSSCIDLLQCKKNKEDVVNFLLDVTYENSNLIADRMIAHKAIKSSIASAKKIGKIKPQENQD